MRKSEKERDEKFYERLRKQQEDRDKNLIPLEQITIHTPKPNYLTQAYIPPPPPRRILNTAPLPMMPYPFLVPQPNVNHVQQPSFNEFNF